MLSVDKVIQQSPHGHPHCHFWRKEAFICFSKGISDIGIWAHELFFGLTYLKQTNQSFIWGSCLLHCALEEAMKSQWRVNFGGFLVYSSIAEGCSHILLLPDLAQIGLTPGETGQHPQRRSVLTELQPFNHSVSQKNPPRFSFHGQWRCSTQNTKIYCFDPTVCS